MTRRTSIILSGYSCRTHQAFDRVRGPPDGAVEHVSGKHELCWSISALSGRLLHPQAKAAYSITTAYSMSESNYTTPIARRSERPLSVSVTCVRGAQRGSTMDKQNTLRGLPHPGNGCGTMPHSSSSENTPRKRSFLIHSTTPQAAALPFALVGLSCSAT